MRPGRAGTAARSHGLAPVVSAARARAGPVEGRAQADGGPGAGGVTSGLRKILILGGYGTFGGRLVLLLAGQAELTLIVAGRSLAKARGYCARLKTAAQIVPAVFDRSGDVDQLLRAINPDIVVDATGPFQDYGSDPYRVVRAAIGLGIHYIDLADGAGFVNGIAAFDVAARDRGVFVLS